MITSGNGSLHLMLQWIGMLLWLNGKKVQETGFLRLKLSRSGEPLAEILCSGFMANVCFSLLQFITTKHSLDEMPAGSGKTMIRYLALM
jgi:hypothetical protein